MPNNIYYYEAIVLSDCRPLGYIWFTIWPNSEPHLFTIRYLKDRFINAFQNRNVWQTWTLHMVKSFMRALQILTLTKTILVLATLIVFFFLRNWFLQSPNLCKQNRFWAKESVAAALDFQKNLNYKGPSYFFITYYSLTNRSHF